MKENNTVYIGIGTNIGDRFKNIEKALEDIKELGIITKISKIYETKPVGYKDQDDFLNLVIELETELQVTDLIIKLQEIEHRMGRIKTVKNGPRIIDLDILLYNNEIIRNKGLIIPHPEMHKRSFVLEPFNEIEPKKIHPVLNKTIRELYGQI